MLPPGPPKPKKIKQPKSPKPEQQIPIKLEQPIEQPISPQTEVQPIKIEQPKSPKPEQQIPINIKQLISPKLGHQKPIHIEPQSPQLPIIDELPNQQKLNQYHNKQPPLSTIREESYQSDTMLDDDNQVNDNIPSIPNIQNIQQSFKEKTSHKKTSIGEPSARFGMAMMLLQGALVGGSSYLLYRVSR